MSDTKIIGGIFLLFSGFYVLLQKGQFSIFAGLLVMAIGLYLVLKNIK